MVTILFMLLMVCHNFTWDTTRNIDWQQILLGNPSELIASVQNLTGGKTPAIKTP